MKNQEVWNILDSPFSPLLISLLPKAEALFDLPHLSEGDQNRNQQEAETSRGRGQHLPGRVVVVVALESWGILFVMSQGANIHTTQYVSAKWARSEDRSTGRGLIWTWNLDFFFFPLELSVCLPKIAKHWFFFLRKPSVDPPPQPPGASVPTIQRDKKKDPPPDRTLDPESLFIWRNTKHRISSMFVHFCFYECCLNQLVT